MHITKRSREGQTPVTTLVGEVKDQAELMGVLNNFYKLHMPIISVEILSVNDPVKNDSI